MHKNDPDYRTALEYFAGHLCSNAMAKPRSCLGEVAIDTENGITLKGSMPGSSDSTVSYHVGFQEGARYIQDVCVNCRHCKGRHATKYCNHPMHPSNIDGLQDYVVEEL